MMRAKAVLAIMQTKASTSSHQYLRAKVINLSRILMAAL
jgi:hypothetical protein